MQKIIYLCLLFVCYPMQATLGSAVDFVSDVVRAYNQEEPKYCKELTVRQKDTHLLKKLGSDFAQGFSKALVPAGIYVVHRVCQKLYHDKSIMFPKILCITEQIALLGIGVGCGDFMSVVGTLRASECVSLLELSQGLARIAGSATAMALLLLLKTE